MRWLLAIAVLCAAFSVRADEPAAEPRPERARVAPKPIEERSKPVAVVITGQYPYFMMWAHKPGVADVRVAVVRRKGRFLRPEILAELPSAEAVAGNRYAGWEVVGVAKLVDRKLPLGETTGEFTYVVFAEDPTAGGFVAVKTLVERDTMPPFEEWKLSAVDDKGVAVWWKLRVGVLGQLVLFRAPAGAKRLPFIDMKEPPAVGPTGIGEWSVVAVLPPNGRGYRDARVAPGDYVYALALMEERTGTGDVGWKSLAVSELVAAGVAEPIAAAGVPSVLAPDNDDGTHLDIRWKMPEQQDVSIFALRSELGGKKPLYDPKNKKWSADWQPANDEPLAADKRSFNDTVDGPRYYAIVTARLDEDGAISAYQVSPISARTAPITDWFDERLWATLAIVALMLLFLWYYIPRVRKDPEKIFIRRIPGVDAIEEAVGRSTEMGRPVLYVTGVENIQNIQTIASLLCLGPVAEMTAEYDTELKVANFEALTMVVAEEIVKQGYANAGRADAHRPENVMFISSEQFAFAAGVNGIILRDKPATNIYLGRFFAESLILAETGYVTKSIQIAGTAEVTQLPFFIAACDYTIIGEELYAVSAYLSRDPKLLATLKASDMLKLVIIVTVLVGAVLATLGIVSIGPEIAP
jgi:hypothetical protein